MELHEYVSHYFGMPEFLIMFLLSFLVLGLGILLLWFLPVDKKAMAEMGKKELLKRRIERYFEVLISGTSILFFIACYYLMERFVQTGEVREYWDRYHDFWLLALLILSVLFSRLLDGVVIPLRSLTKEDRSAGRLIGMLYMLLIFAYVKYIYENNNYDVFITYFLGLMIGRFVYFDTSLGDFIKAVKGAVANIPLMILGLIDTAVLSLYGFGSKYLIKHIGVITNVFFLHLFLCAGILIFQLLLLPVWKEKSKK